MENDNKANVTLNFGNVLPNIHEYESSDNFPETGAEGNLYIDLSSNRMYRYDFGEEAYIAVVPKDISDRLSAIEAHLWHIEKGVQPDVETGCSVTLSHTQATVGTIVTATIVVGAGYNFDGLTVKVLDNRGFDTPLTVPVTDNGDGTYGFAMPFADVSVYAGFAPVQYAVTTDCDTSKGDISAPATAVAGEIVDFEIQPLEGYDFLQESISVLNETTGERIDAEGGENTYSFTMPAAPVTISVTFASVAPQTGWKRLTTTKNDYSGDYIMAGHELSVEPVIYDGGNNNNIAGIEKIYKAFVSPLANYIGGATDVISKMYSGEEFILSGADNATLVTFTKKGMVDSGTYSGKLAYSIGYLNANNERKYLTYSAQGLSNMGTDTGNNSQWIIYKNDDGFLTIINKGSTNMRLYHDMNQGGIVQKAYVSGIPEGCRELTLFEFVQLSSEQQ